MPAHSGCRRFVGTADAVSGAVQWVAAPPVFCVGECPLLFFAPGTGPAVQNGGLSKMEPPYAGAAAAKYAAWRGNLPAGCRFVRIKA